MINQNMIDMNNEKKKEQKTREQIRIEETTAAQMASIWY